MSESDPMFNERDRRCAAVQPMLSTDPSYENRTIASTLKMQILSVQRTEGTVKRFGRPFGGGGAEGHIMPPHIFEVGLKVNTKVLLGYPSSKSSFISINCALKITTKALKV